MDRILKPVRETGKQGRRRHAVKKEHADIQRLERSATRLLRDWIGGALREVGWGQSSAQFGVE